MAEVFDAYRKWLGIPPEEQPPHYYRLLSIGLFESDPDVIQEAADRQMSHVQKHKIGRYSAESQKLLNQLAAAKLCLLNPEKKAAYDKQLREKLAQARKASAAAAAAPTAPLKAAPGMGMAPAPKQPLAAPPPSGAVPVSIAQPVQPTAAEPGSADYLGFDPEEVYTKRTPRVRVRKRTSYNVLIVQLAVAMLMITVIVVLAKKWRDGDNTATANRQPVTTTETNPEVVEKADKPIRQGVSPAESAGKDSSEPKQPADNQTPAGMQVAVVDQPRPRRPARVNPLANAAPGEIRRFNNRPLSTTTAVALSEGGTLAFDATEDRGLQLWDVARGAPKGPRAAGSFKAVGATFVDGDEQLVAIGDNGTILTIDLSTGRRSIAGVAVPASVTQVHFSADGRLAVLMSNASTHVIDLSKPVELHRWTSSWRARAAISGDGSRVLLLSPASEDQPEELQNWAVHTFHPLNKSEVSNQWEIEPFTHLALSHDGSRAAIGTPDGVVKLIDVAAGGAGTTLEGDGTAMRAMAFTPDGRYLLTGGDDQRIHVWDTGSLQDVFQLEGHTASIVQLATSLDGRFAVSASDSADRSLRVWRLPGSGVTEDRPEPLESADPGDPAPQPPMVADNPRTLKEILAPRPLTGEAPPSEEQRAAAMQLLKDAYKQELEQASNPQQKADLAQKMLDQSDASGDAAERFVLLSMAGDLASEAGQLPLALQASDRLSTQYAVSGLQLEVKLIAGLKGESIAPADRDEALKVILAVVERAMAEEDFAAGERALVVAAGLARNNAEATRSIAAQRSAIAAAKRRYDLAREAAATLDKSPDDPAANLAAGEYLCFFKSEWEAGLTLLAKGADSGLKKAAQLELSKPEQEAQQVELGDTWWELASKASDREKVEMLARAQRWYNTALPRLTGLTQTKVSKRLEELSAAEQGPGTNERPSTGNLAAIAREAVRNVTLRTRQAARKTSLINTRLVGYANGNQFLEMPPNGGLLVGIGYSFDSQTDQITAIRGIYLTAKGNFAGQTFGQSSGMLSTITAKEGYAVSGLEFEDLTLGSIRVTFARLQRDGRLDLDDQYTSAWMLPRQPLNRQRFNNRTVVLGNDGNIVVGLYGHLNNTVRGLGLIQVPATP